MSELKTNPPRETLRTIKIPAIARVEGEAALHLEMDGNRVQRITMQIYEPPRFFEAFLRGRDYHEVPDITARICGICPVAYQMGSCHAIEKALGIFDQIDPPIRELRTLLYCGEWIESHILHMFMLHLPDFLGYESAISMAQKHGPLVKRVLRIKKFGNTLVSALAGRSVHPVGVCIGGFYRALDVSAARELLAEAQCCRDDCLEIVRSLPSIATFPNLTRDYEFLSVRNNNDYPMNLGNIATSHGDEVDQSEFLSLIEETQAPHSTALYSQIRGRGAYVVGPLARLYLNHDQFHPLARSLLDELCQATGSPLPWRNNYLSLLARGVETVHALARAVDILQSYREPARSRVPAPPRAGTGAHGTEAPRGICWHQYTIGSDGLVQQARIIPPTSQNQFAIQEDLATLAPELTGLDDEHAALRCEHLIRNYDPCISCSVHFLKLRRTQIGRTDAS